MRSVVLLALAALLAAVAPVRAEGDAPAPISPGASDSSEARSAFEVIPPMLPAAPAASSRPAGAPAAVPAVPAAAAVVEVPAAMPASASPLSSNATTPAGNGTAASPGAPPGASIVAPAAEPAPRPFALPQREVEIPHRFVLGLYRNAEPPVDLDRVRATVREAATLWRVPAVYLAWYAPGRGVALLARTLDGGAGIEISRADGEAEASDLEKRLAFPITPKEIARIYLDNEVVADDDFKGKPVIFEAEVADIARGAFGRPYVFFPAEPGGVTGLTCYFDAKDPALRKIRKGSRVLVRAEIKGFLMQDVILDKCLVVDIQQ